MKNVLVRKELFYSKIIVIVLLTVFLLVSVAPATGHSNAASVFGSAHQGHFNLIGQHYNTSDVAPSTNVVPSSVYPIGSVPANSVKGSPVSPFYDYSTEPAPMGIADYGIGPNCTPYEYNTTSFLGIVGIDSLSTYNSSLSYLNYTGGPYGMTFQLNVNLQFHNGASNKYVYWVQDVADLNTSSNNITFLDNVWNLSESNANMHNSTVSGNGTVANSSGRYYYYDLANLSMSGNDVALHYPTKIEFKIDSLITSSNQPEVAFMYNDGYGWITYDNVVFKFISNLTADYGFVVNGYHYEPDGYSFYDAELILGGPGGGTQTNDNLSNLQLQLEYWNGHNFQQVVNAFNFGSDTAEGIHNVVSSWMYYNANGALFAQVANGTGSLMQIYNRTDIGIINVSTTMSSGTLIINGTSYPFINCDVNVTLYPGHYVWELYSSKSVLVAHGDFNLSAGQYLAKSIATSTVTFTELGLQSGRIWYVNVTENNRTFYDSGAITGSSYSFSLVNGSYTYTIATSDKIYEPSQPSGSFTVSGATVSESTTFSAVEYSVTFTESGLSSGTSWSVTLNGTTLSSTTNTITFSMTNGTYSYSIGKISGYNISISSGSLTISGRNVTQSITFSSVPSTTPPPKQPSTPTSSNTDLYIIIGAVAAVAVVGAVVAIMRKRK